MVIILNPRANHGRAWHNWKRVEGQLRERLPEEPELVLSDSIQSLAREVKERLARGETRFIAAGGDGTVNSVLNALVTQLGEGEHLNKVTLGAIGLGSSNDFHKPWVPASFIGKYPAKTDCSQRTLADVAKVEYVDGDNQPGIHYFMINASLGLTAAANDFYNHPSFVLALLKPRLVNLSILYAAVRTLLLYRNQSMSLSTNDETFAADVSNLSILKKPHFAGNFFYDTLIYPDDGLLTINGCLNMNRAEMVKTMISLSRGRFGRAKTKSWTESQFKIESKLPIAFEVDGEVFRAKQLTFAVLRRAISVCA